MNAESPVVIRLHRIGLYLLSVLLAYLAGSYVAPFFLYLFILLALLPVVSLLYLVSTFLPLRYYQEFSNEHPVKGESVVYHLILANETVLPVHSIRAVFKTIHPFMEDLLPDFTAYIRAKKRLDKAYTIHCPFRGIYNVGLEFLEAEDPLHLFVLRRRVWYRTFYVYPRVLTLDRFTTGSERSEHPAQGTSTGAVADFALFSRLKAYRHGESLHHVAWKKFASTGTPFLKDYDTSAEPGVTVYFDLRRTAPAGIKALETEDVSVDILVALVKYYLERGVPVAVRAPGRNLYTFRGSGPSSFGRFYRSTMELMFQSTVSPASLFSLDRRSGGYESGSALFVSHLFDPEIFAVVEQSLSSGMPAALVLNRCGHMPEQRKQILPFLYGLTERGADIRFVDSPEDIVPSLQSGAVRL